jgi:HEPN domain-containing protein
VDKSSFPDPERIFLAALTFEIACGILTKEAISAIDKASGVKAPGLPVFETTPGSPLPAWCPIIPSTVLSAFALELYFKSILTTENKSYRKIRHDLHDLFKLISPACKKKLRKEYQFALSKSAAHAQLLTDGCKAEEFELERVLKDANHAFTHFRYEFERPFEERDFMVSPVAVAARRVLLTDNPSWRRHLAGTGILPP